MTFPTALTAMLQAIGALLVFVAGYLALVLSTIICLVVAELISERSRDVRMPDGNVRGVRRKSAQAVEGA
jgi:hypothetical protein